MVDSILSVGLQGVYSGVNQVQDAARKIASATTTDVLQPPTSNSGNANAGTQNTGGANTGTQNTGSTNVSANGSDLTGDLATSIVDLKIGENQVKASAAVIRTADEVMGTLIDIKT